MFTKSPLIKTLPAFYQSFPWLLFLLCLVTTFILENRMDAPLNWLDQKASTLGDVVESGDIIRKIVVSLLGMIGAACLLRWNKSRFRFSGPMFWIFFGYIAWSLSSCIWADNRDLTARRLIGFVMMTIFELACVARMDENVLSLFIAGLPTLIIIPGIIAEISCGTFQPLSHSFRFSGTSPHPNVEAAGLSLGVILLCWITWQTRGKMRLLAAAITVFAFAFLWLTGSRTSFVAFAIAFLFSVAIIIIRDQRKHLTFLVSVLAVVLSVAGLATLAMSSSTGSAGLLSFLNSDRDGDIASGNGRVELWQDCLRFAAERPVLGYGFGGFWSEKRIQIISENQGWAIEQSHSAYVDQLLSIGIPGAVLYIALLFGAFAVCLTRFFKHQNAFGSWAALLLIMIIVNFTESINMGPLFPSFTFELIALHLALVRPSPTVNTARSKRLSTDRTSVNLHSKVHAQHA